MSLQNQLNPGAVKVQAKFLLFGQFPFYFNIELGRVP